MQALPANVEPPVKEQRNRTRYFKIHVSGDLLRLPVLQDPREQLQKKAEEKTVDRWAYDNDNDNSHIFVRFKEKISEQSAKKHVPQLNKCGWHISNLGELEASLVNARHCRWPFFDATAAAAATAAGGVAAEVGAAAIEQPMVSMPATALEPAPQRAETDKIAGDLAAALGLPELLSDDKDDAVSDVSTALAALVAPPSAVAASIAASTAVQYFEDAASAARAEPEQATEQPSALDAASAYCALDEAGLLAVLNTDNCALEASTSAVAPAASAPARSHAHWNVRQRRDDVEPPSQRMRIEIEVDPSDAPRALAAVHEALASIPHTRMVEDNVSQFRSLAAHEDAPSYSSCAAADVYDAELSFRSLSIF